MDTTRFKDLVWQQFGAAIQMLENAIRLCPEDLWKDRSRYHKLWHMAFHTLFWLDLYLSGEMEGFKPPEPFGLEELDPKGVLPDRVYTKDEMLGYLDHCQVKGRSVIDRLDEESETRPFKFPRCDMPFAELLLYNLRHVQHHTAQINLLLRQEIHDAPRWVGRVDPVKKQ